MKKILTVFIALLMVGLMVAGTAYAGAPSAPAAVNAIFVGGTGVPGTPPMEYVLVRNANQLANMGGISSGDVLIWDTVSADGVAVTRDTLGYGWAGVAVTNIATSDSLTNTTLLNKNWGYMAVRGYALAQVDTSAANTGFGLRLNGATLQGTFGTADLVGNSTGGIMSEDCGVLLIDNAADGLMPVWLR